MGLAPQTTEPEAEQRWRPRRVAAGILRLLILVVPIAVGFAVGATVSLVLP
jgi:hypothetical protein